MHTNLTRLLTATVIHSRLRMMGLTLLALALVTAGCAAPSSLPATSQPAAVQPTATSQPEAAPLATATLATVTLQPMAAILKVSQSDQLGQFLVDDKGMTLYLYTKDTPNTSNCYDKCEAAWPPLFTNGTPVAGDGLQASLLGVTTRKNGQLQATYNGWPLYYWVKDQKPGDTTGQDVGGVWYVISPKGERIQAAAGQVALSPTATVQPTSLPAPVPTVDDKGGKNNDHSVTIKIENFKYAQQVLTIAAGTTVEWENEDTAPHTVTADDGTFDSGNMNKGDQFKFTFTSPGTYLYYCTYHGGPGGTGQAGQIIVQ